MTLKLAALSLPALKSVSSLVAPLVAQVAKVPVRTALGVTSLAVGATELLAPRTVQNMMGVQPKYTGLLRVLGVRECLHGVDLLAHDDPKPGIYGRCAGDMLDGVLLAAAATKTKKPMGFATIAALVAPIVIADMALAMTIPSSRR